MPLSPEQYLQPDVIQQIQRLDLKARFIVEGFISGLHKSPFQGFSVEFSEHRKYSPGDDIRRIDWGVYAKTDRYYIKKFEAETNLEAYLLMDCSGSMDFATGNRMTKMDYGICVAAALGHMMVHQQDPVGLCTFDEKVRSFLPPKSKRTHLTNILTVLAQTRPFGETRLGQCLHEIAARIKRRSMIIIISDLLGQQDAVIDAFHHFRHYGHDLIVFQVLDYNELAFEFDGRLKVREPETGDAVTTDGAYIRAEYVEEIRAFIERYRHECLCAQADFVTINNAMTFDAALMKFLRQRQHTS